MVFTPRHTNNKNKKNFNFIIMIEYFYIVG